MRYRLNDGTIGTMIPDDQVPEWCGSTNPDKDGDLWLQVDGEKVCRVVAWDECECVGTSAESHRSKIEQLRAAGYMVYKPGDIQPPFGGATLPGIIEQLRAAKYTVLSPTDTVARARSLMAGLEAASNATGESAAAWFSGKYDECAVKAYTYLLEWARSL